ncbi:hypothetical protein [Streptomyces sp. NPDC047841]|uniref:hypothetical protein n=1 Tax=Streptomyces sp. NPDC047841 TaxID=3154708 RepID=UPI00345497AC
MSAGGSARPGRHGRLGLRSALWLAVIGGVLSCLPLVFAPVPAMRTLPDQAE